MITLVTGTPGAGKTLWVVREIKRKLGGLGRPIFHTINDFHPERLDADWTHIRSGESAPFDWFELHHPAAGPEYFGPGLPLYPCGSIFVLDEVQDQWPASLASKLPEYLARLTKHRHRGFDFYVITQHPKLIAPIVRRLVGKHHHLFRPYQAEYSRRMSWEVCNEDPPQPTGTDLADVERVRFDKSLFGVYGSAVLHTGKLQIPRTLIGVLCVFLLLGGLSAYFLVTTGTEYFARRAEDTATLEVVAAGGSAGVFETCAPVAARYPLTARVGRRLVPVPDDFLLVQTTKGLYACADLVQSDTETVTEG